MRIWRVAMAAWAMTAGGGPAHGQEAPAPAVEPMRRLAFLVGDWEGEAWIQAGPGARRTLRQTETVRYSASGHALLIEGAGFEKSADGGERLTFNAVATLTHEAATGYRMRSVLMEGRTGEFEVVPGDSGFVWGFDTPQGKVRYTMRLTPEGAWLEIGEFAADGTTWRQFMEMVVRRVR